MSQEMGQKFADALHKLEDERDLETIVAMYAENCEVGNVVAPEKYQGLEGARKFWTIYRDTFGEVHSEFRNIFGGDNRAVLEWTTSGTSETGGDFSYDGVSILELEGDKVSRFRAYFDASALGRQITPPEKVKEAAAQQATTTPPPPPPASTAAPNSGSTTSTEIASEAAGTGAAAGGYGGTSNASDK